jgi:diaminopimelate epimerase
MNDVSVVKRIDDDFYIHTGSPHYIRVVDNVSQFPVFEEGRKLRYSPDFAPGGTNVNFIQLQKNGSVFVRTYERGVENETLSCGTGVTAAALAASMLGYSSPIKIQTLGGDLSVEFKTGQADLQSRQPGTFYDIFLVGPAKMVFKGELEL